VFVEDEHGGVPAHAASPRPRRARGDALDGRCTAEGLPSTMSGRIGPGSRYALSCQSPRSPSILRGGIGTRGPNHTPDGGRQEMRAVATGAGVTGPASGTLPYGRLPDTGCEEDGGGLT
jgi:hypothetical protein